MKTAREVAHEWFPANCMFGTSRVHSAVCDRVTEMLEADRASREPGRDQTPDVATVAKLFHDTYERLAPGYGYQTRKASALPWDEVPTPNRELMMATVAVVLSSLSLPGRDQTLEEAARVADELGPMYGGVSARIRDLKSRPQESLGVEAVPVSSGRPAREVAHEFCAAHSLCLGKPGENWHSLRCLELRDHIEVDRLTRAPTPPAFKTGDVGICDNCGDTKPLVQLFGAPINGGFCATCRNDVHASTPPDTSGVRPKESPPPREAGKCATCGGDGRLPWKPFGVNVASPNVRQTCHACNGTGSNPGGSDKPSQPDLDGRSGGLSNGSPAKEPRRLKNGEPPMLCEFCDGTGRKRYASFNQDGDAGEGISACPKCKGDGLWHPPDTNPPRPNQSPSGTTKEPT